MVIYLRKRLLAFQISSPACGYITDQADGSYIFHLPVQGIQKLYNSSYDPFSDTCIQSSPNHKTTSVAVAASCRHQPAVILVLLCIEFLFLVQILIFVFSLCSIKLFFCSVQIWVWVSVSIYWVQWSSTTTRLILYLERTNVIKRL